MRRNVLIAIGLAGVLALPVAVGAQESTTIRIRFVNGRNGKPLRLKNYERGANSEATDKYKIDKIQGDSLFVTFKNASDFAFRSEYFEPCDVASKTAPQPRYSLQTILSKGQVAANYCGHPIAVLPAKGELVIYSRHEHWWKLTGRVAKGLLICG